MFSETEGSRSDVHDATPLPAQPFWRFATTVKHAADTTVLNCGLYYPPDAQFEGPHESDLANYSSGFTTGTMPIEARGRALLHFPCENIQK